MVSCPECGRPSEDDTRFCPWCGAALQAPSTGREPSGREEQVHGIVLFGGYYKDICFTDSRVIQFEPMSDRWKFLAKPLGMKPLVVEKGGALKDVLLFRKGEVPRADISRIDVRNHGRFTRGHISLVKRSGEVVQLARINVEVDVASFGELADFVRSIYPEMTKDIS